MPRRREVPKRNILPDPKFGSQEVSKFVNVLMTGGKKSAAAELLGISRKNLWEKLRAHGIEAEEIATWTAAAR